MQLLHADAVAPALQRRRLGYALHRDEFSGKVDGHGVSMSCR